MSKRIKWTLVIIWMITIFWFSNQPAVISDEKSKFVIYLFKTLGLNLDNILGQLANFIVRKAAHFTEYMILYILLFNALNESFKLKKALILSLAIVFLYSCSDELHQYFIPGRTARVRDVIIDTCGGIFALLMLYLRRKSLLKK
ncbi:VanZ family protein [Clostridium sp. PL3]|uniref:VanZ family protein n=1 Tax=Clostridium thailandense TaxID=2794346 RepID=A0A949U3V5_9CLOT|nr:VanZ family protein [Clostridium thailandense]MBV7277000.1 VanZ family protein [Clostridium thailandense]